MEAREMAICRSVFYYPTLLRRPLQHQVLYASTCRFPNYPSKFSKSSKLPLLHRSPRPRCTSSMESPSEGYRKNVGICLINPSKKIFAASRLDLPDAWQMPQGGIDESEDPKVAAIRELKEETGVSSAEVLAETPSWLTYDFPPEVREKLKHQWGSDWKGQAQKWFLLKFTGNEEEINLLGDGTEKPEFGEWSWMSPEQIIDMVVDFKKPVYEEVLAVFVSTFATTFAYLIHGVPPISNEFMFKYQLLLILYMVSHLTK